jgi:hypothetical protein
MTSGTIFTTFHFIRNFGMGPLSWSVLEHRPGRLASNKNSSLVNPFISYEENEVM